MTNKTTSPVKMFKSFLPVRCTQNGKTEYKNIEGKVLNFNGQEVVIDSMIGVVTIPSYDYKNANKFTMKA